MHHRRSARKRCPHRHRLLCIDENLPLALTLPLPPPGHFAGNRPVALRYDIQLPIPFLLYPRCSCRSLWWFLSEQVAVLTFSLAAVGLCIFSLASRHFSKLTTDIWEHMVEVSAAAVASCWSLSWLFVGLAVHVPVLGGAPSFSVISFACKKKKSRNLVTVFSVERFRPFLVLAWFVVVAFYVI